MRYFTVEKEILNINKVHRAEVYYDGSFDDRDMFEVDSGTVKENGIPSELTTMFVVFEYDEHGMACGDIQEYPVKTDMTTWENNEQEVLAKIAEEHPAPEWQNNRW